MRKYLSLLVLLEFIFPVGKSQANFKEGYIILNSNDTISGLIQNNGKRENSLKCVFMLSPKGDKTIYSPDDIKGYRFTNGKYYVSKTAGPNSTKKIFLEFLFEGISDLYYYTDIAGDHYLIDKNDQNLQELKNTIKQVTAVREQAGVDRAYSEANPVKYERESKEYIGILKNMFIDGPATMSKVESISLSQNSLVRIAEDYHREVCPGDACTNYSKRNTKVEFTFGPIAGVTFSRISFKEGGTGIDLSYLPEDESIGISLGAFLNLRDPTFSEKYSLQVEVSYYNAKFSTAISSLDLSTLKIPVLIKYTYPSKRIQPSALIGLGYNRILKFEDYTEDYGYMDFISGLSQYCLTAGIETAFKFNDKQGVFLGLRYEYFVGQNHLGEWDYMVGGFHSRLTNINLLAGFMF